MEALRSSGSALKELPQRRSVISPTLRLLSEWPHSSMSLCRSGSPYRENHHRSLCLLRGSPSPIFPNIFSSLPSLPCLALPCHPCWRVRHTSVVGFTTPVCRGHTIFLPPHLYIPPSNAPTLALPCVCEGYIGGMVPRIPRNWDIVVSSPVAP